MSAEQYLLTLFLLVAVHFVCDFPLQNDYMARTKDHTNPSNYEIWIISLVGHGFIHGLGVYLVTLSLPLAVVEVVLHSTIDYQRCGKKITYFDDQVIHIATKVVYVIALVLMAIVEKVHQ